MKKIISIFLAVCMLLANISVIAEENAGTEYKHAVELLSMLNVISVAEDNDDFSTQSFVTREEFCVYLSRAFKIEASSGAKQIFTDVDKDSALAPYISTLYDLGVISGYGGEFRPNDIVTYNEAVKMLVSALKYDYAADMGGYPTGYLRIASDLEITKGIYNVDRLTKGVAAQLIYNAMLAPVVEMSSIKETGFTLKTNKDKSVLTELYNIYEGKGVVLASGNASLASNTSLIEVDEVLIEDEIYKVGESNVSNLIGHYIEFLYLETDDEFEIIRVLKDKGEEFVINSNQILNFEDNTYKYEDADGKTKKVKLNSDFLVMYNFDYPDSGFDSDMMEPDMGRVKLVKSGKGSGYTAVIIEECVNSLVAAVDVDKEVIYLKDRTSISLGAYDYVVLDATGKKIELSAIKEWNVVSMLTSSDGKKATVYVSNEELVGKTTKIGDAEEPYVTIGGTEYYVDPDVISKIDFNKEYVFYFDYCGNIAGVSEKDSDGLKYAYLLKCKIDDHYDPDGDDRVWVELFTEDGVEKRYYLSKKVRINDASYKENPEGIVNSALNLSVKILKYKLDSNGEINTLYVYDATSDKYIRQLFNGSAYWNVKQRSFGGKVTMETSAPVFVVPEGYDAEDYQVVDLNSFPNDKNATVKVYTMGDNVYGDVILRDSVSTNYERPIAIVQKVIRTVDEYDDLCTKITVLYNGAVQEFTLAKEEYLGSVEEGDVIKISLNHMNQIQGILHIYDQSADNFEQSTNPYEPQSGAGYRSENRFYYGYAYDLTDGLLRYCKNIPTGNSRPETENALVSAFRIYIIDGPEIRMGNENDIRDYTSVGNSCSKIIVQTMWGDPEDIVIIEG